MRKTPCHCRRRFLCNYQTQLPYSAFFDQSSKNASIASISSTQPRSPLLPRIVHPSSDKSLIAFIYDNNNIDKSIRKVRMSGRTGCGREPVGQTRIYNNSLTLPAFPSLPPLCINSYFHRLFGIPFRKKQHPVVVRHTTLYNKRGAIRIKEIK